MLSDETETSNSDANSADDTNSTDDANSTENSTLRTLRLLPDHNYSLKCDIRELADEVTEETTTDVTELKGTKYTLIPLIQALVYIICFFFGIINVLGLNCFVDYEPDKFANLGKFKSCFSVIVRLMPGAVGFFHYVLFLLILI